ncbi:cyclic pyranopterin phosphate synthase [Microbacterium testaceum]|uniref:GTP 3',8-cyclase MoaA n=1 Tax=Microbacterium testaceum TaxID=2033 RepID=UPI0027808F19|nr:GTP 3',8-cyclase MoaA [Microbacterium testaceum]MDQ1174858.1 cyclic pyranopterin phosphate synthase [Microbacterium testaceum]
MDAEHASPTRRPVAVALGATVTSSGATALPSTGAPASGPSPVSGATALAATGAPQDGGLLDRFGRVATDLRVSVIDKCNLRCTYCMPADGMPWLPQTQLMSTDEIRRIVRVAVQSLGAEELRITGGEPLVRKDLEFIIAGIREDNPDLPISMTTNAVGLDRRAQAFKDAGLTRLNVSLDTLHPETFAELTRRPHLDKVLAGLQAARAAGLGPIKINAVLLRGINDTEIVSLVDWAVTNGFEMRFIEDMPLDGDRSWMATNVIAARDIRAEIETAFSLAPDPRGRGAAPAERWEVRRPGETAVAGHIGIISSVTEPFCAACTRTRVTADGKVRSCLFSHEETDLLSTLRAGADDAGIAQVWREAMWAKPRAHGSDRVGLARPDFVQPERTMSAIGG